MLKFMSQEFPAHLPRRLALTVAACAVVAGSAAAADVAQQPPQLTLEQRARAQAFKPENFSKIVERMNEVTYMRWVSRGHQPQPFAQVDRKVGQMQYGFEGAKYRVDDMFTRVQSTGMVVLHEGKLVYERYRPGSNERTHFMSYSAGKSVTGTLIGAALGDGKIGSLNDQITKYVPELKGTAYEGVTIKNALQMSSGVRFREMYSPELYANKAQESDIAQLARHGMILKDMAVIDLIKTYPRAAPPGTVFNYSTAESQVLGMVVKGATGQDPARYLEEKIWSRIGMENDAGWILDQPMGMEGGGGGILATVRDYARFGQLMLQDGVWNGERILPRGWVKEATIPDAPQVQYGKLPWGEPEGYQYQWWAVAGPDHAYCAEGVHGQMIYVNPVKKLVVARTSEWPTQWDQKMKREAWIAFEEIGTQLSRRR